MELSEHTHLSSICHLTGVWLVAPPKNHKSSIKDHLSQLTLKNTIIITKTEILRGLSDCETETQCEQMLLEQQPYGLAGGSIATKLQYVKITVSVTRNKTQHSKMRYAWGCIKYLWILNSSFENLKLSKKSCFYPCLL